MMVSKTLKIQKGFEDNIGHLIFEGETNRIKAITFDKNTNSFYVTVVLDEEKKLLDIYEIKDEGLILEFHY